MTDAPVAPAPPAGRRAKEHDAFYRDLFSRPAAILDLLRFLDEPFLGRIDPAAMRMLPAGFVTADQGRLEADMIWCAPLKRGRRRIYIHIEFQSRPDRRMLCRMWDYRRELRRALVVRGEMREDEVFEAAVYSLVLYSGLAAWKMSMRMADLLPPPLRDLVPCQEEGGCRFLCIRDIPRERLTDHGNVFVLTALLEQAGTGEEILEVLELIMVNLAGDGHASLRRLLLVRVERAMRRCGVAYGIPALRRGKEEDDSMFEDRVVRIMKDWKRRLLEEGEAKGRAEGEAKGRAEGEATGEARGMAKGMTKGRELGLVEGILSVARNLLAEGTPLDVIVRVTRLPLEDVRRLAAETGPEPAGGPGS